MATVKVSALTETTSPNSTDELLVNQSGTSKKLQIGNLPASTPADDSITYAKIQNVSTTDRILGRDTAGAGDVEEITPANLRTMINVADGSNNYSHPTGAGNKHIPTAGASGQFLKYDSSGTAVWAADNNTVYVHPNHSGDVVSSADGAMTIQVDAVDIAMLSATGAAGVTTFLRGDNSWVVPTDTNTDTKWDGGATGLTASTGRTSLGLEIGTNVQAYDATIMVDADIGSTVQAYDADTAKTDTDQSWTGSQRSTLIVDNDGSFDMNGGNNFKCTVSTGTITVTFTNITNGQSGFILLVNSGATIAAHANTKVDATILATLSTSGTYLVSYLSDGTNVYLTNSAVYT